MKIARSAAFAACLALLALPFSGARAQQHAAGGDPGVYTTHLSNGLQVIVVEDHAAPVVECAMWYRFGSLDETPGKTGLAHALEHMMFRGSAHISAGGLDDITERLGAQMNGQTDYDYTQFYFVLPADKLNVALTIEADRMRYALLRQSDWNIERGAVLSELDSDAGSPFFDLLSRVRAAAYPDEPNGRVPIGIRSDVVHATAADIARYYREWYAPNNAALVVAGDADHTTVFHEAEHYFGAIPARRIPAHHYVDPRPAKGAVVEAEFPFPFEVLDLAYAVPGDTEPGEPAISTLATLIANERSPFHRALVDSNVALAIDAESDTQLKGGLLNVFIVLNPGHTGEEAQQIFQTTMERALATGFSPSLVEQARSVTIAQRLFSEDSIQGFGDLAGYTYGIVGEHIRDEDARLAALTQQSLLAAARRYLRTPTVVGHLRPHASPRRSTSNTSSTAINDDFSTRVPNGPIIEPASIRRALRTPTTARSPLFPTTFTLPNGLRVIVQEKSDRPTFTMIGRIASSPAFEPPGEEGMVRLVSDLADYGSAAYPYDQRLQAIDDMGAQIDFGQNFDAKGLARDFDKVVAIVADGEEHPAFPEPWFSRDRGQIANSVAAEQEISGQAIDRLYNQNLLAPDDPALRRASAQTIASITRDDALAFATRYWRPDLTIVAVVGDVTPAQVRAAFERSFAGWKRDGPTPNVRQEPLPAAHAADAYIGTEANEVYVRLGEPAVARTSPDYDAFLVLNQILGASGAFESRLWQELRQKRGLVYAASSRLLADRYRGNFQVELEAAPQHVVSAVAFVRGELRRLQEQPVTATELAEAKLRLAGDALLAESSADGQAQQLLEIAEYGLPLSYYRDRNEELAHITAADVERVAREYLDPDRLIQIYAGPSGPWATEGR
ncbi:MAG: M16 family metallopeptidase [Candidatus Tyrphobacter sp.]